MMRQPSRPTRARGLKPVLDRTSVTFRASRPTRARGLKQEHEDERRPRLHVAPHAGAWIETPHT